MFTVDWRPAGLNELADIWLQTADRNAVTQATHRLDERLQRGPIGESESREAGRRILIEPPLGVLFRVDDAKRIVYVLTVWRFETRP
jgi:plasmid stabilization system protein ParE